MFFLYDIYLPIKKAPYLKAKFRVGSCKGNVNFHLREHVFHSDDIPSYKKAKKREVCMYVYSVCR